MLQNGIILLIINIWKFLRYTFCRAFNSECLLWVSLRWRHCVMFI